MTNKKDSIEESNQIETAERLFNFNTVLEDSLNEIFIFDAETLKFIQVNKGARQNLGYSIDELLTMTPFDTFTTRTINESAHIYIYIYIYIYIFVALMHWRLGA